jgi:cell surface protein SprA
VRLDFSIRDNKNLIRRIVEPKEDTNQTDFNQPSSGQRIISIAVYGEYQITKNFSGKIFYNHTLNDPILSNQYKNLSIDAGISFKIMLTQM